MSEEKRASASSGRATATRSTGRALRPVPLGQVEAPAVERLRTGIGELDRVLGGGLVPASLVLVSGDPGIGKSTLLLMALRALSLERKVLLVTGEESAAQVKLRADRLGGAADVRILAETGCRVTALRTLDGTNCVEMPSGRLRLFLHEKGKAEAAETAFHGLGKALAPLDKWCRIK